MTSKINRYKQGFICAVIILTATMGFSQPETSKWKLQLAFGLNSPNSDGFIPEFEPKSMNFPTINFGLQHMFSRTMGAKLDYGYNRFSSDNGSTEIKTNYSRINAQFVYDGTKTFGFLPERIGLIGHAGPGYSIVKPLSNFGDNKASYLNVMAGVEIHYNASETFSVYTDFSYILGMSGDKIYDPVSEGYGTFNGNLFAVTIGVSVSLSGCYYCD